MPVYMVDRTLTGISMDQLAGAQKAAIETSQKFTREGKPVRYIRTTFVPGEAHCMCLFEAQNSTIVKEVNEAAKLPFTRIVEAMDLNSTIVKEVNEAAKLPFTRIVEAMDLTPKQ